MDSTSKPQRKRDLVWREVDGEVVILTPDNKRLQVLNDVGSRIWALLDGERDVSSIADIISSEYGERKDVVEKDALEHLEQLRRMDLLEK